MTAPVHLDLTELVANPLRSGIQRVEREAIRHWPGPAPLVPCRVDDQGQLIRLPNAVLDVLCAEDDGTAASREAERDALTQHLMAGAPISDQAVGRLLNLELYFSPIRADAHLRLAAGGTRMLWYLYDFLPFLRPDLFPQSSTRHCMHFLRGLRSASHIAFLSEQTRQDYARRVARVRLAPDTGPVLLPGADGLRLERQTFASTRREFVAIGTVEPRKNPMALLEAFQSLWDAGVPVHLVVAGRIAPDATEARAFFARHTGRSRLVVMDQPADEMLRTVLRRARAVVMPSEAEGFGLPPYEALHAGIPAIVSANLPSVALLPSGAMLLKRMDAASIAASVAALLDDATAARLWRDAARVELPTWVMFGRDLGAWTQAA
jgi:glycosyltransferase involved in cell wall biosynthesis